MKPGTEGYYKADGTPKPYMKCLAERKIYDNYLHAKGAWESIVKNVPGANVHIQKMLDGRWTIIDDNNKEVK